MVWIIGGTKEAGILAEKIHSFAPYIMTVATEDGKEFFKNLCVKAGRMDLEQMIHFCKTEKIKLIADISHPYAEIVSANAEKAALTLGIEYLHFIRAGSVQPGTCSVLNGTQTGCLNPCNTHIKHFGSVKELCSFLKTITARVFFTTGSKNIPDFEKVRGSSEFVYRILPSSESIIKCRSAGVEIARIVAMLGPFSEEMNKAMFKEFRAEYAVMKDSGENGGVKEKLKACGELGITALIIGRSEKTENFRTLKEIQTRIETLFRH